MKKISLLIILTILCFLAAVPAWAAPVNYAKTTFNNVGIESFTMLKGGTSDISTTDGALIIRCTTSAYSAVNEIGLYINIQRWNGSSWVNYSSLSGAEYYSDYILRGYTYSVPKGYSYRLVTKHYVKNGLTEESGYTTTNGYFVS